ncbi:hypothetical protein B7463_g8700, partial [Scytalidium lignicola]
MEEHREMAPKIIQSLDDHGTPPGPGARRSWDRIGGGTDEGQATARLPIPTVFHSLEFVDMNAATHAERERNRRIVRSTAMRSFRQKQKQKQQREMEIGVPQQANVNVDVNTRNNTEIETIAPDDLTLVPENYFLDDPWITTTYTDWPEPFRSDFDSSGFITGVTEQNESGDSIFSKQPSPVSTIGSPLSLVGQGRVDPFRIENVNVDLHFHELMDHSLTILWPGFRVPGPNGSASHHPRAWLEKTYERPVVKHAMLFGASVHMDVLRSPHLSLNNPVRLYHKIQTMKLLKEELKRPEKTPTPLDDIILSVLTLGTNEVELLANIDGPALSNPFNSPMISLQWLDLYGSINHIPAHTTAMRSLVDRRGGLEKIELNGLAEILSFSDILDATQKLSKPFWPLLVRTIPTTYETPNFPPKTTGRRFQDLLTLGINDAATTILQAIADLTVIIDHHCRGINFIPDINIFVRHRNTLQHRLMSLPRGEELEYGEVNSICLYESIRHTAILFSVAVTFALPPQSGIFQTLASRLKTIMEESKFDLCWQLCPETLMWMLVLGGIASAGTTERNWYVQNLAAVSAALKLSEWDEVEKVLSEFLWLRSVCGTGGRVLWIEVMNDRALQQHSKE